MRVIAGKARSLQLKTPVGLETRPTTDRIKETLFNMISTIVPGSIFVDLFSGSGAIGIEALSRGAKHAYFVESAAEANKCIVQNLNFTKLDQDATLIKQDVLRALMQISESHVDIIFMDPPYRAGIEEEVLKVLMERPYVDEETTIIVEALLDHDFSFVCDLGYEIVREKCYKTNKHVFIRRMEK